MLLVTELQKKTLKIFICRNVQWLIRRNVKIIGGLNSHSHSWLLYGFYMYVIYLFGVIRGCYMKEKWRWKYVLEWEFISTV